MRKGLKLIYCSGCTKPIWKNDIEGYCHYCKIFYGWLAKNYHAIQSKFTEESI